MNHKLTYAEMLEDMSNAISAFAEWHFGGYEKDTKLRDDMSFYLWEEVKEKVHNATGRRIQDFTPPTPGHGLFGSRGYSARGRESASQSVREELESDRQPDLVPDNVRSLR